MPTPLAPHEMLVAASISEGLDVEDVVADREALHEVMLDTFVFPREEPGIGGYVLEEITDQDIADPALRKETILLVSYHLVLAEARLASA